MQGIKTYRSDEVTQAVQGNKGLFLIHFGSPLASSCEFVHKELELLAPRFGKFISFGEVDLPLQDLELIQTYRIEEIPTLVLFDGKVDVERLERVLLPEEFCEFLETAVSFYGSDQSREAL